MSTPQPDAARPDRDRLPEQVSDLFDPMRWRVVEGFDFEDLTYHRQVERDADGRWVLMEAELIEPDFYLAAAPEAGARFGQAVRARLER